MVKKKKLYLQGPSNISKKKYGQGPSNILHEHLYKLLHSNKLSLLSSIKPMLAIFNIALYNIFVSIELNINIIWFRLSVCLSYQN